MLFLVGNHWLTCQNGEVYLPLRENIFCLKTGFMLTEGFYSFRLLFSKNVLEAAKKSTTAAAFSMATIQKAPL